MSERSELEKLHEAYGEAMIQAEIWTQKSRVLKQQIASIVSQPPVDNVPVIENNKPKAE
jgi:hypothetical protein